ncbi:MAG: polyphosphate:AMP phosphotransferase [Deltaproteobacteria bacterium]|nr:polyphosphate:AMP phosphotransferase [Deltaproteobacteria bacterium]
MFESAELGHKLDKATFKKHEKKLRAELLDAQYDVLQLKKFPVLILVNGVDGAGKGETVNLLNEWMDPRHVITHAFGEPTDEELERPFMWRFWRALPPAGKVGIMFGNWYTDPIVLRATKQITLEELDARLAAVNRFEELLAQSGALVLKFWFHLSKDAQKQRLKDLEKDKDTRWRVTGADWKHFKMYDRFRKVDEHVLRRTSTGHAPWLVVEGSDERYRSVTVAQTLVDGMRKRLKAEEHGYKARINAAPLPHKTDNRDILHSLKLDQALTKKEFDKELEKWQGRLALLSRHPKLASRSVVAVFEGQDAAGKGGAIRRVTQALDARRYHVIPIAAPTDEERAQPYLWRFWRHIPRNGMFTIFDRSWYGRVLVERVEGFCSESDWMRAYTEINDFEDQLVQSGDVVCKFWLAISQEEQLRRFKEREATDFKRFKITQEDWRNRKKWPDYERAVCDMIDRTSTERAPWTLVEANNKYHARIKVLRTFCKALEDAIG